nr:hypothetical protein CFP56_34493 [Quercus suber]
MNYGQTKEKISLSTLLSSSGHIVRREGMWLVGQEGTRSGALGLALGPVRPKFNYRLAGPNFSCNNAHCLSLLTEEKIPLSTVLSSSGHIVRHEGTWQVSQEGIPEAEHWSYMGLPLGPDRPNFNCRHAGPTPLQNPDINPITGARLIAHIFVTVGPDCIL